jgi:hypothetical protein
MQIYHFNFEDILNVVKSCGVIGTFANSGWWVGLVGFGSFGFLSVGLCVVKNQMCQMRWLKNFFLCGRLFFLCCGRVVG